VRNRYAVIGSGRQGVAAGYDLARFGSAEKVLMIDDVESQARNSAEKINNLLGTTVACPHKIDIRGQKKQLEELLKGVILFISTVPYQHNFNLTLFAVHLGVNMVDLGGHTWTTRQQLSFCPMSDKPGVTVVPDCGMGPGMNISLALYAISLLDTPREVLIWDGGLPQNPKPPLNYFCSFSEDGLLNEYSGKASFIRNGKVVEVPALSDLELVDFGPQIGMLEAFVTSGGLSTAPWTFQGKLQRLENKTLRYLGHCNYFKVLNDLGFLDKNRRVIGELRRAVRPYDVLRQVLMSHLPSRGEDVCVVRVKCSGDKDGKPAQAVVELIDYFDPSTGFTAMQRLTGWHASIVGQMAVAGLLPSGAVPVEMVPGPAVVAEARKRGFIITEKIEFT